MNKITNDELHSAFELDRHLDYELLFMDGQENQKNLNGQDGYKNSLNEEENTVVYVKPMIEIFRLAIQQKADIYLDEYSMIHIRFNKYGFVESMFNYCNTPVPDEWSWQEDWLEER